MYDLVIIGGGPSGITAGIYVLRAGFTVKIISKNTSELLKAKAIENYFGFPEVISGAKLLKRGKEQFLRLGGEYSENEVTEIDYQEKFIIKKANEEEYSKTLIIATGKQTSKVDILNYEKFLGKGISHCAICDGFFFKGKDVCVLGNGNYALSEANILKNIASKVTILTNSENFNVDFSDFNINTKKIKRVIGETLLTSIEFETGEILQTKGLFIAIGYATADNLEKKVYNAPGFFKAGDCTGETNQIITAAASGANAGLKAAEFLNNFTKRKE